MEIVKFKLWVVCMMFLPSLVLCWPYLAVTEKTDELNGKEGEDIFNDVEIYEMLINANIANRFARTLVTSKVLNPSNTAKETTFSVLLPDRAFISEFIMIIDGKSYKAYVKEKNEAKQIYDQAIVMGMGAAHVEASARDSNRFTVSVNIEPQKKVIFQLTYEELLSRREGKYEMIINIHPKQPIENLYVNVMINESRPLTFVTAPPLRTGNEIISYTDDLDPRAQIAILNSTSAIVHFSPDIERQKELAKNVGTDVNEGLSAQFVVQYDVERDPNGGEVLIRDGYFVHFFAPKNMEPLNKFILFVLDTSGSMWNGKLKQLKDAMSKILDQLDKNDLFHIISFGSSTKTWNINNPGASVESPSYDHWFTRNENDSRIFEERYPSAFTATIDNVQNAKNIVSRLNAYGGTNIYEALRIALHLVKMETRIFDYVEYDRLPMIMFLTDGDATTGITSKEKIIKDISKHNTQKIPIYSLSFGSSSDKNFLKKLSLKNMAFSRHIYADSDAALQLQNFYKEISLPLLSDVKFNYVPEITSLTETNFPVHFKESEIVVAGKIDSTVFPGIPMVMCKSKSGYVSLPSVVEHPVTSLERLWAYLTIQQLLDKRELVENKTAIEREALNLALKYSFVTKISSLVVVKPNGSESEEDMVIDLRTPTTRVSQINKNRFHSRSSMMDLNLGYRDMVDNRRTPSASVSQINKNRFHSRPSMMNLNLANRAVSKKFKLLSLQLPESLISSPIGIDLMIKVNKLDSLKHALPWLSKIINDDGTIKTTTGNFDLGVNATTPRVIDCPNTPNNSIGQCKLLHECPQVYNVVDTVDKFNKYYCLMDQFAGICCPLNT